MNSIEVCHSLVEKNSKNSSGYLSKIHRSIIYSNAVCYQDFPRNFSRILKYFKKKKQEEKGNPDKNKQYILAGVTIKFKKKNPESFQTMHLLKITPDIS